MELLQLKYFYELAQSQHLSKTAEKLMISAPSLSITISKLEKELGVQLFDRRGRSIQLNDNGRIFLKYITKALQAIDSGMREMEDIAKQAKNTLRIAITSPLIWSDFIQDFQTNHPRFKINLFSVEPARLRGGSEFDYDFFLGNTKDIGDKDLESRQLRPEELPYLLVSKAHPLSERASVDVRDLCDETFITLGSTNPSGHQYVLDMCALAGFRPKKLLEADYFMRVRLVRQNKGVAITSSLGLTLNFIDIDQVAKIPVSFPIITRTQAIAWKKDSYISEAAMTFMDAAIRFYDNGKDSWE